MKRQTFSQKQMFLKHIDFVCGVKKKHFHGNVYSLWLNMQSGTFNREKFGGTQETNKENA